MIKSFKIQNFQSHKNTTLDLSPGVNAIVGKSNNGKTSIVRAMQFILQAKGSIGNFISSWALTPKGTQKEPVKLIMTFEDLVVTRGKNKSENYYQINDDRYDKVGGSLPENVANTLKINDISIQSQFDKHFLISSTSGEVGKYLGDSVNLASIDVGLQKIKSDLLSLSKESNRLYKDSEEKTRIIESMHWIDVFAPDFDKLAALDETLPLLQERYKKLEYILKNYQNSEKDLKKYESLDLCELQIKIHEKLIYKIEENRNTHRTLKVAVESYNKIKLIDSESISEAERVIKSRNDTKDRLNVIKESASRLVFLKDKLKSIQIIDSKLFADLDSVFTAYNNSPDPSLLKKKYESLTFLVNHIELVPDIYPISDSIVADAAQHDKLKIELLDIQKKGSELWNLIKKISELSKKCIDINENLQYIKNEMKGKVCEYCGQIIGD